MKDKFFIIRSITILTFFLSTNTSYSQDLSGKWSGYLDFHTHSLKIVVNIEQSGQAMKGIEYRPDESDEGIPIDTIWYDNGYFAFQIRSDDIAFSGCVNHDFSEIRGTFVQYHESIPLVLTRSEPEAPKNSLSYLREHYRKQEVYIPMRDGIKLFTSIYTPKDAEGEHPMLMVRTPYDVEPREDGFNSFMLSRGTFVEDRYIFVFQDVRGRYMSEGEFVDVRPIIPDKSSSKDIDESTDTYDAMEWLINHVDGNNGNIGILGTSYPGFYATMSLPGAHPTLKAVSPQAPVGNWFIGDDWHHNGAFFLMDAFNFYYFNGRARPEPTRQKNQGFSWPVEDNYEFFMRLGPVKNIAENYFGDTIVFWNQLVSHPDYDAFWKARTPLPHLKNITPAVMTVGGWYDAEDLYGPLKTYQAIETQNSPNLSNRLVMGPWSHGQWNSGRAENLGNVFWGLDANEHFHELEYKFFSYYLTGEGDMDLPEATIFNTGTCKWMEYDHWPPSNIETRQLYFQPRGGLSFKKPSNREGYDEYIADPKKPVPYQEDVHTRRTTQYMTGDQRFASRRQDVLVYSSEILSESITFAGP